MRSRTVRISVIAGLLFLAAGPTTPEATGLTALNAESRFTRAHHVTRWDTGGDLKEAQGVLISDSQGKEVRFEGDGRAAFAIPHDRITAMHWSRA